MREMGAFEAKDTPARCSIWWSTGKGRCMGPEAASKGVFLSALGHKIRAPWLVIVSLPIWISGGVASAQTTVGGGLTVSGGLTTDTASVTGSATIGGALAATASRTLSGSGGFPYLSSNALLFEQIATSGTVTGSVVPLNLLADADSAQNTTPGGGLELLRLEFSTGAQIKGSRVGLNTVVNLGAPSANTEGTSIYGGVFDATASSSDGGSSGFSNQRGGLQAMNAQARAYNGAANLAMVNGAEIDTVIESGSSAGYKVGAMIVQLTNDAVRGTYDDVALSINNPGNGLNNGGAGWSCGVCFGSKWASWPIASNGTIILAQPNTLTAGFNNNLSAENGIDFSNVAFSGYSLKLPNFNVDGAGVLGLASVNANSTVVAGGAISAGTSVSATTDLTAGRNVIATRNVVAGGSCTWRVGSGDPNGAVTGNVCDLYTSTAGGAGTTFYVKESGAGTKTGWVGK